MYHTHLENGAIMMEEDGWLVPQSFGDPEGEMSAAVSSSGLVDVSNLAKIDLRGRRVDELAARLFGLSHGLSQGELVPVGKVEGDAFADLLPRYACKLARDEVLFIGEGSLRRSSTTPMDVEVPRIEGTVATDVTPLYACLGLIGPVAPEVLGNLVQVDVSPNALRSMSVVQVGLANVHAVLARCDVDFAASRLPSYHIFVGSESADYVWKAITEAGGSRVHALGLFRYRAIRAGGSTSGEARR